jgi:AcrR family transcriptional regulator
LLEEEGVGALTVKAVTDRADVGHGTFYHHFTSTEDVLTAGIEESMREFAEALQRDFSDADDKSWVFVASMTRTLRMLATHPALAWMLERPHVLARAIRQACGPFAQRDLQAMVEAGDVGPDVLPRATSYWDWIMIGALLDAAAEPDRLREIESIVIEMALRNLRLSDRKIAALLESLRTKLLTGGGRDA